MKKELVVIGAVCLIIAFLGLFQTLIYVAKTPAGVAYPLVHNYEQDFYWYLSLMRQGWQGSLTVTTLYSAEKFSPQFVNTFFPLLGMFAKISRLSLPVVYTLMRILGGAALLFTAYILALYLSLTRTERLLALIIMIFGVPFWTLNNNGVTQQGEFWTGFDPILRIAWLPHHTIANALAVVSLIFIIKWMKFHKLIHAVISAVLISIAGWLNPASFLIFLPATLFGVILSGRLKWPRYLDLTIYGALILLPTAGLLALAESTFPWTAFRDWERFNVYPITIFEYMTTLGIVGILAISSIPFALYRSSFSWRLVVGWFLMPLVGMGVLTKYIPVTNSRFLQSAGFIPAALLAVFAIRMIQEWLGSRRKKLKIIRPEAVVFTLVTVIVLYSLPGFYASISRQMHYVKQNMTNPLVMISQDTMAAIKQLSEIGTTDELVLAYPPPATLIPAFTGKQVVVGHPTFSYKSQEAQTMLSRVYAGNNPEIIDLFFESYDAVYVWINYRVDNDWNTGSGLKRELVYQNPGVYLYRFTN